MEGFAGKRNSSRDEMIDGIITRKGIWHFIKGVNRRGIDSLRKQETAES
jgi:hypothetical protein